MAKDWTQEKAIEMLEAENASLRAALRESADELDAYYRAEYPGDHPHSQKKLQQAMASNPARAALDGTEAKRMERSDND